MAYPDWLFARQITTISVTPGTLVAGTFTPGTGKSFYTTVDEIEWALNVESADVRPITQFHQHMVPVGRGNGFRLREILRNTSGPAGESGNALADMFHDFEYFQVVFTRASRTWTGIHSNGGYVETPGRDRSTGTGTFSPVAEEAAVGNDFDTGRNVTRTGAGL